MDMRRVVGANVRKYRLAAALSQEELALRVEIIDQGYVSGLERGKRNPTAITLRLLADALGVEPGLLFETASFEGDWARGPIKIDSRRVKRGRFGSLA